MLKHSVRNSSSLCCSINAIVSKYSNEAVVTRENFEFSDEESYACNLVLEKEESRDAFINGQTVVETIKTVSTVIRKFILVYQIDDVFDWEDKNIRGESLINNIRIRTGHIIPGEASIKANPPSPIAIPGACERDADSEGNDHKISSFSY